MDDHLERSHSSASPPIGPLWDQLLTRQHRVLLHIAPLIQLLRSDEYRPEAFHHYDSLSIALKLMNTIIEHTGFEPEIDRSMVIRELFPLLEAMDHAAGIPPDAERHSTMAIRIFDALWNRGESFDISYTDFDALHAYPVRLHFRLLEERYSPDGRVIVRLSHEAINILLHGLTLDIEDAQAATEAVIQSQLTRGKFHEAVSAAQIARTQSLHLAEKLEHIIFAVRKDIQGINWHQQASEMIRVALNHLLQRCETEATIVAAARTHRDQVHVGSEEAWHLSRIIALVQECHHAHMDLHKRLLDAPRIFLEEQERQVFAWSVPSHLPSLLMDILQPMLAAPSLQADRVLPQIFRVCTGPSTPPVFSLSSYLHRQIQLPRPPRPETLLVVSVPRKRVEIFEYVRYPVSVYQQASIFLAQHHGKHTLSSLLQEAHAVLLPREVIELCIFAFVFAFDPLDKSDPPDMGEIPLVVTSLDTAPPIVSEIFSGSDMEISFGEAYE